MLKYAFLVSFFFITALEAQEHNYLLEHYTKSGAIPKKEVQNVVVKNIYYTGKENSFQQHRSIASRIQHTHIIKIVNRPLEIRAQ